MSCFRAGSSIIFTLIKHLNVLCRIRDENGTQLSYVFIAFCRDGRRVSAIGGSPDFRLYVWDLTKNTNSNVDGER